ncbi:SIS domain-containing protein [Pseudomonas syringae pv. daphniphylli]|uniref:SIS domain-containing protein n=1 Tax=Pseudomonas syringae pv. daphniphylli TaxID=264455 RepID=A0A9X0H1C7_PSESX|nr:SIS domain-containing protein [Pseudomonas syringae pv. daphniphylli]
MVAPVIFISLQRLHHVYTLLCECSVKRRASSINIYSKIIFSGIFFPYRYSSAGTMHRRVSYSRPGPRQPPSSGTQLRYLERCCPVRNCPERTGRKDLNMTRADQPTLPETSVDMPPTNAEGLLRLITDEYDGLPRQLKRIASYMSQQSDRIMVDRISDIARECEVHPSAIVRFSQRFGFSGFSEMQALFREAYTHKTTPVQNYQQRIRSMIANKSQKAHSGDLARECVSATLSGLERLSAELDDDEFEKAVDLVVNADNIYVVGVRRSFAVADYLVYNLQHTNKRIHLISGLGGSYREQMRSVRANDLVIAISFTPYGKETQHCLRIAQHHQAKTLIITDSNLSPLAKRANSVLLVNEGSSFAFRSLSATLCLCQALFIAVAYRLELKVDEIHEQVGFDD